MAAAKCSGKVFTEEKKTKKIMSPQEQYSPLPVVHLGGFPPPQLKDGSPVDALTDDVACRLES